MLTFAVVSALCIWQVTREWQPGKTVFIGGAIPIKVLEQTLDQYRDRADTLYKLIVALMGLSTFYSLVIGAGGYFAAQFYEKRFAADLENQQARSTNQLESFKARSDLQIEQMKDRNKTYEDKVKELESRYPSFARMDQSISRMIEELDGFIPEMERITAYTMDATQIQRGLSYERVAVFLELLGRDSGANDLATRVKVYRKLSQFHQVLYLHRTRAAEKLAASEFPALKDGVLIPAAAEVLDRAEFYARQALRYGSDFRVWNELGRIFHLRRENSQEAFEAWKTSRDLHPDQQRAQYGMAFFLLSRDRLTEAEELLSDALDRENWESTKVSLATRCDIYYNRACVRSRLSQEAKTDEAKKKLLDGALEDLKQSAVLPADKREIDWLKWLKKDVSEKDLKAVYLARKAELEAIFPELKPGPSSAPADRAPAAPLEEAPHEAAD